MKLKLTIAFFFLATYISTAFGGASDSLYTKKITHHFQLLIGNYSGESFASPNSNSQKPYYYASLGLSSIKPGWMYFFGKPTFTPMYSYSIGFDYKADLSQNIGIRAGLNYFTYGYISNQPFDPCPYCVDEGSSLRYKPIIFTSSFNIPIQLLVYKPLKKGRFIFSTGLDFYLPINTFGSDSYWGDISLSTSEIHTHVSGIGFLQGGSMGFSLGLGYEKVLSKKFSIELLPDIHLTNLVPFDFEGQGTSIYKNYIFNTAIGLSTYLSFSK